VALDRQSIEKKDFPVGSHGYDPQAVDDHLSAMADEIAEFKSASRRRAENMASSASEQVRAIIDAAESSAAEIQRSAEAEAQEIREEAHQEARATRERAAEEVQEHVNRVAEATGAMLGRLEGMEAELSNLLETVRSGAGRLDSDVRELNAELEQAAEVAKPPAQAEFQPDLPPEPEPVAPAQSEGSAGWETGGSGSDWASSEPAVASEAAGQTWDGGPSEALSSNDIGPSGTGEGGESAVPAQSWDAGASSAGWGAPGDEAAGAETPAGEGYGSNSPAGEQGSATGHDDWQHPTGTAPSAPVEPGSESFPDAPSAPPGGSAPEPYGDPSHGSFEVYGPGADTPHDSGPAQGEDTDDSEGARLIALNMALNGTPRDETARYLSENFQLSDRNGLLDEVYASVEG
jgi:cell division septum initiation protein DivIVA